MIKVLRRPIEFAFAAAVAVEGHAVDLAAGRRGQVQS
jgi:hypothetical protein